MYLCVYACVCVVEPKAHATSLERTDWVLHSLAIYHLFSKTCHTGIDWITGSVNSRLHSQPVASRQVTIFSSSWGAFLFSYCCCHTAWHVVYFQRVTTGDFNSACRRLDLWKWHNTHGVSGLGASLDWEGIERRRWTFMTHLASKVSSIKKEYTYTVMFFFKNKKCIN